MNGRQKTRLRQAREQGYLDARCPENVALLQAFGMWCWKLKLPMVWIERRTRYSRFARVRLDMFTCGNCLTAAGQEYLKFLSALGNGAISARVSAHDAVWDRVAPARVREAAHSVLRAALQGPNVGRNEVRPVSRSPAEERGAGSVHQPASSTLAPQARRAQAARQAPKPAPLHRECEPELPLSA